MGLKSGSKSGKGVKQGASKLGQSKSAPPNARKPVDSDEESDNDTSVMRPSIEISVSTVPQLVRAYQAATEELKSILAKECDIIYECRVCRNLFRSLANMMAHKRIYCKTTYSYTNHTLNRNHTVEDYTVIIQPEAVPSNSQDKQNWTTSDKVPDCSKQDEGAKPQIVTTTSRISSFTNSKKGLREIVDRLTQNSCTSNNNETKTSSATKLYDNIHANVLARKNDRIEHSFHLEEIETTKVGVFQTKLASAVGAEKDDLMKAQVSELQHMASQNEATLGPDGRMLMLNRHSPISVQKGVQGKASESGVEANEHKVTKDEHVCPDCNVKFSTRKTLNHHMKSLHVTFRLCYPCPCCKSTFVNPWSVYRHLYKVHRKTAAQVRRLRPQIQKKAFKKEIRNEVPVPESNPKSDALKELQRLDQENQAWMDNFEDDLELQRCGGCGRRFERRAALNSHSQICQKRIAARNNVKAMRNLQTTSSPDKVIKVSPTEERRLPIEANKTTNNVKKSIVSVNTILKSLGSTRTNQGGNWVEQPKKEIPEKKIEIQIRKDYCKMSSASSVVALSNDTQSEPDSRPPSRMVEDDCSADERDWDSMIEMEEVSKEESDSEYHLFRDAEGPDLLMNEDGKEDEDSVGTNSPVDVNATGMELNSSVQDTVLNRYDVRKDNFCMYGRTENVLKRRVSEDDSFEQKNDDKERIKRRRKSFEDENYNAVEDSSKNMPSKSKKLEQFHPVMEARMKKLINIRRLQCLPCQKKFIKLTNLRRHVAVHIGWCRYKCMLCPFKCFSKYDCVDHVCKIHLKGTQRSKAATMVEYIEEQESEASVGSVEIEESNYCCDIVSNEEETSEPLSVEMRSLNLEDIKNIVGVTCFSDDVGKSEHSNLIPEVKNSLSSSEHSSENETVLISKKEKDDSFEILNDQTVGSIEQLHDVILKEENMKSIENKVESSTSSKLTEEELKQDNTLPDETTNVCDDHSKEEQIKFPESVCIDEGERKETKDDGELRLEACVIKLKETEDVIGDEPKQLANVSSDICIEENSPKNSHEPVGKEEISNSIPKVICEENEQNPSQLVMEEDSKESFKEPMNSNDKKCDTMECYYQASEVECAEEMIVREEQELEQEQPVEESIGEISDSSISTDDNMSAVDCKSEEEDDDEKEYKEPSEIMDVSHSPLNPEKDENALRKMVMEVIFGSGGTSDSHPDTNQNLISATVNGSACDEDSNSTSNSSSDGRYSRASSASDSDVVIVSNHVTSPSSEMLKKDVEIEHGHSLEGEKRERPVRNRVKVEKEDFIYDFTDSFLKKEEPSKVSGNIGSNTSGKKKLADSGKESVKYDHSHNSTLFKSVPKMMIVRTDSSESAGSKCVTGPIKGSWSSVYAPTSDCAGNKNYMESNSQMCSSSRKVPRTYDVKQ